MATLRRAGYAPENCEVGVVHIGVGAFHRAHQAQYFDDLLHDPAARGWAVAGVNLLPNGGALLKKLAARDGRYVLKTTTPQGQSAHREIAAIRELADAHADLESAANLLARPAVQLATMTVTESGYYLNKDGALDTGGVIGEELAGAAGHSIYHYLRRSLNARRAAGAGAITLLCCDNLRDNGEMLRAGFTQYLKAGKDGALLDWLEKNATFPCCMVDRITPAPTAQAAVETARAFGIDDDATVAAEDYIQWVIADNFAAARPPLEKAGAQLTADVRRHEEAKIRILNGAHFGLSYHAARGGIKKFDEAITHPALAALFDHYINSEVIPALCAAGVDKEVNLPRYRDLIKSRFSNAHLGDTVARICQHGADKVKDFILPTLRDTLAAGKSPNYGLTLLAGWYLFMRAVDAGGIPFNYDEPHWESLRDCLGAGRERNFAASPKLWGELPEKYPAFVDDLEKKIKKLAAAPLV